ncbi:nucleotidyltransferase family protein [Rubrivirga sp.]|uniref:nucleotidyltransferase family protein n=1 Tax=Rubrivirga sp. TaxID=1885344 RepID=UPI003B51A6F8
MPAPLSTESVRARLAALLPELRAEHGVRSLSIFGSYARGEQTAESDLDLLVEFDRVPGMLGFVGLAHGLEDQLGLRVDLATRPMLKPRTVLHVERDLVPV